MKSSIIKNRLFELSLSADIIILKGFPIKDILKISDDFHFVDNYVIENGKIDLGKIDNMHLLQQLIIPTEKKCILTYESFLNLTTMVRNLSAFNKQFCVLSNNLLNKFENPTTESIPDFDSEEFQSESVNSNYAKFYSYCIHEDSREYIQYIEYSIDDMQQVDKAVFFNPIPLNIKSSLPTGTYASLSSENGTLDDLLESIYYNKSIPSKCFLIDRSNFEKGPFEVLQNISDSLHLGLEFYWTENNVEVEIRTDLYTILEQTWGYKSFRKLNIYKDLNVDKTIAHISQGEIIERVIREAEHALSIKDKGARNILLTSPTGAGKSLLFQMASIYLAERYKTLTIIVSPLVALMNDQVENLVGNYKGVATLNGNIPATEKEEIINKIKSGEVNILYLAPELLLSYSIDTFIGDRRLGLFVVDEAHTVTTWGRDFRVDYWFLGNYLRQSKRQLGYSFPIFALTATAVWDPSGKNDMVFDTIRSLNMDPCIKYIGVVRREDIHFEINTSNITKNYERERNLLTIRRIHESIDNNYKTIVYFPYKSTLKKILLLEEMEDIDDKVTEYHASLSPAEKNVNAEGFKSGSKLVMCATKAYGMGIDVSDIKMVYHHAPTGCLSDYVQEIGRVARDPQITGIAKIDFSEHDFRYTRTLHGLSAIKSYQLKAVLKKLMALYRMKGEKRNMLISANDFEYIFPGKDVDYDQKVKSCLLLLSNDLLNKLRFNAIIVRPKNLFSKAYISVSKAQKEKFEQIYFKFIKLVDYQSCTYKVDIDELWNKHFSNFSFPMFKKKLADGDIFKGFNTTIKNKVEITLNVKSVAEGRKMLEVFFDICHIILDKLSLEHRRITFQEIHSILSPKYSDIQIESFIETFKMIYCTDKGINGDLHSYCSYYPKQDAIQLTEHGYESVETLYITTYNQYIEDVQNVFFCNPLSRIVKIAELLNSLNIADYERLSGDKPAIFVRINNPNYLNDIVRSGQYKNEILDNIYEKFKFSEWVFTHFFTTTMSDHQRWDFIEAYFLGAGKEELTAISQK